MSHAYVIGCDVGSQGTNAALYRDDGALIESAYEAYDVAFPHPGWAEQHPDVWTTAVEPRRGPGDPRAVVRVAARWHGRLRR